jgi:hypothetical protein
VMLGRVLVKCGASVYGVVDMNRLTCSHTRILTDSAELCGDACLISRWSWATPADPEERSCACHVCRTHMHEPWLPRTRAWLILWVIQSTHQSVGKSVLSSCDLTDNAS